MISAIGLAILGFGATETEARFLRIAERKLAGRFRQFEQVEHEKFGLGQINLLWRARSWRLAINSGIGLRPCLALRRPGLTGGT